MKRIIRLTERDLTRIVKRVIMEQSEELSLPNSIKYRVEYNGEIISSGDALWKEDFNSYQAWIDNPNKKFIDVYFDLPEEVKNRLGNQSNNDKRFNTDRNGVAIKDLEDGYVKLQNINVDEINRGYTFTGYNDLDDQKPDIGFAVLMNQTLN